MSIGRESFREIVETSKDGNAHHLDSKGALLLGIIHDFAVLTDRLSTKVTDLEIQLSLLQEEVDSIKKDEDDGK